MKSSKSAFKLCLNILKFYGVYQIKPSKLVTFRAILMFTFIVLQFLTASLYRFSFVTDLNEFIYCVIYVIFSVNLTIKLMNFIRNHDHILQLIKEVEALDFGIDVKTVDNENQKIARINTFLLLSDLSIGFNLSMSILLLSREKVFTIPLLYYPNCTEAYYMMFGIHYVQIIGIGSISFGMICCI